MANLDWLKDPGWPFLRQSDEILLKEQAARKFDNKTHVWLADPAEGFVIAQIGVVEGEQLSVTMPDGSQKKVAKNDTQEINPPKFEKTEDMSNLTFLNEASVLHNLRQRYYSMMIYTYSGLFCVFINPYKMLPIYTESVAQMYVGRRRTEMPPHLFAVSDEAYRNMIHDHENQSMLITGESGAGKTENTKKVISYFAKIGGSGPKKDPKKKAEPSLENQVVQANPAIEAFGNGATNRNYNSSRFGKFIRIHFNKKGKLIGGDISHYLLEKSRVIKQAPGERSYHVFYQIMTQKKLRDQFNLDDDIRKFKFSGLNEITVPGMDDKEEFKVTDEAFDVMGFTEREKSDLYRLCAAIMHMGNMTFKQKPREEQAEADDVESAGKAAKLLGVDMERFLNALLRPSVKVGTEWVTKGQNVQQVDWAVGALAKAVYARMFHWLINRCNETLKSSNAEEMDHYIGVLDIAGFEIFDRNSFEQLWINFVNEKLQQFFNHHMFVLEQEEYEREGIQWTFIDFGLDLQACIELIEKPLGIVSMLDEECIVPKATDMTYVEKLTTQHLGKHPNFQKAKPPKGKQAPAHFAIVHYAGTVRYNAEQWLDKNKDPLNDSAVAILKTADHSSLVYVIWEDYQTDVDREEAAARGKAAERKKGKSASFLTVSTMYRESLSLLMNMLNTTHPHFIRCIIPNEKKTSGLIDAPLVLNQLTCNGVLEGIRICRKGFPNRLLYPEFKFRYAILAADAAASDSDPKKASVKMLEKLEKDKRLTADNYKAGNTKVFFRAGILAKMEEMRDEEIAKIMVKFQSACRRWLAWQDRARRVKQTEGILIIQENIRKWIVLRSWYWYRLYNRLKPMLKGMKSNIEVEILEKRLKEMEEAKIREDIERKKLHDALVAKSSEALLAQQELEREKALLEKRNAEIKQLNDALNKEQERLANAEELAKQKERERAEERRQAAEREKKLKAEADAEQARLSEQFAKAQKELKETQAANDKLIAQRKAQEMHNAELSDQVDNLNNKLDRMTEEQKKLQQELEAAEERYLAEKRQREDAHKARRKLEGEVKRLTELLEVTKKERGYLDADYRKREQEAGELKIRAQSDANLIAKLQISVRQLIARIEELEEELENETRGRLRAERQRADAQSELEVLTERMAEASGQLNAQVHINKTRAEEVANLHRELQKKNYDHENHIADLCSLQYSTLNHLRNLNQQAASLETEAARVLDLSRSQTHLQNAMNKSYVEYEEEI